jgi:hypothetical protein
LYGLSPVHEFLGKSGFDLLCRAHQPVMAGFEFPFEPDRCVVTLFSAPNYSHYRNSGAVMSIDRNLSISFEIFEPRLHKEGLFQEEQPSPATPANVIAPKAPLEPAVGNSSSASSDADFSSNDSGAIPSSDSEDDTGAQNRR